MKRMLVFLLMITSFFSFADAPPKDKRFKRDSYVQALIKPGDIGAEIGVFGGVFAYHVLLQRDPAKLYLIDPWIAYKSNTQEKMDERFSNVCRYFEPYENVEIIRSRSEDVAHMFPDEYFDYVYIDGEHSYDAVTRDLTHYFSKVKVNGYLIGDDYGWTGIKPAVQDFLSKHKKECIFLSPGAGQYAIQKIK